LDNLFSELYPMNSKWQKFGEMLGMDEDLLDEIFTYHERDEECLRDMLGMWFKKSENPTWRAVTDALQKIGEGQLAESMYLKCEQLYCFYVGPKKHKLKYWHASFTDLTSNLPWAPLILYCHCGTCLEK